MVRSKFPGKPSKIISRKIVDSAKFTLVEDNDSAGAAESISYGLAMFNGSFGGDRQVNTPFFSSFKMLLHLFAACFRN